MTIHHDDGLPDDRIVCRDCLHFGGRFHCAAFETTTLPDLPRRCVKFIPAKGQLDMRTGAERWPGIVQQIQELAEIDRQHETRRKR